MTRETICKYKNLKITGKSFYLTELLPTFVIVITLNNISDLMRRPKIVELISKSMKEIAPEAVTILYGSEARGTAREDSDFDVLVLIPDESQKSFAKRKIEIFDKLYEIELERNVMISPIILLKSMWERRRTPFTCNVMNEGIII